MDDSDSDIELEETEYPWQSLFTWCDGPFYGYVKTFEDALLLVKEFSFTTSTSYVVTRSSKAFGRPYQLDELEEPHFIRWQDDGKIKHGAQIQLDGKPFIIIGCRLMECHQGTDYHKKKDPVECDSSDHGYQQASHKRKSTGSKKRGCPAAIYLRDVVAFPEFQMEKNTAHYKAMMSAKLQIDLQSPVYDTIEYERYIWISLPQPEQHIGHIMGDASDLKAPIDERITKHVYKLVDDGVYNVMEMKRHVRLYTKSLFGNGGLPKSINRRFFPSREDLRRMIYRRRRKIQKDLMDQELLATKIKQWKEDHPEDTWFFRPSACVQRAVVEDEDESSDLVTKSEDQTLLLIYQSRWQQRLLQRYGKEMVFLDATYKTTKYALPLFFLCVHTNTGYAVVGTVVMETEDSQTLTEALSILREINPDWATKSFMVDYSEIEMNAIKESFPEADIFICDFHRKQAWNRWMTAIKHGVADDKNEILSLLNAVAESETIDEFNIRLYQLTESQYWKDNPQLQNYLTKQWLPEGTFQKWVWAFRNSTLTLVVNTNNGVEAQNHVFKHEYLAPYRTKTLSGLMSILVQDYFEDVYRKYLNANVTMSEGWREGSKNIPDEFHHRPQHLVSHMREVMMKASSIGKEMVTRIDDNTFSVKSSSSADVYKVIFNTNDMPSCNCRAFLRSHLLCKHFGAVFNHFNCNWNSLPELYRENVMFVADADCINMSSATSSDVGFSSKDEEEQICDEVSTPESSIVPVHVSARRVREVLTKINNLTFLAESAEALEKAREDLEHIADTLKHFCPSTEGLVLEPEPVTKKTKMQRKKDMLKELPRRKRKKKHAKNIVDSTDCKNDLVAKKCTGQKRSINGDIKKEVTSKECHPDPDELLKNVQEFVSSMDPASWTTMLTEAKSTSHTLIDMKGRIAFGVLETQISGTDIQCKTLQAISNLAPSNFDVKSKYRLTSLILSSMEENGYFVLPKTRDPRQNQKEADEAMLSLQNAIKNIKAEGKHKGHVKFDGAVKTTPPKGALNKPSLKIKKTTAPIKEKQDHLMDTFMSKSTINWSGIKSAERYYVCEEVLEGKDLKTLKPRQWLNDKVINAFLFTLMQEQNKGDSGHCYVIASYLAELWNRGRYNHFLYKKVKMSLYEWIFLPISVQNNHWILLAANVPQRTVHILDSLCTKPNSEYIAKWRKYMHVRANEVNELHHEWKTGNLYSSRQKDGDSCGVFVLLNAFAILYGEDLGNITQIHANAMRSYVCARLMELGKKPPCQRTICDMVECKKPIARNEKWIKCDVCGRWCHFSCVNLDKTPEDYSCPVCDAQYI